MQKWSFFISEKATLKTKFIFKLFNIIWKKKQSKFTCKRWIKWIRLIKKNEINSKGKPKLTIQSKIIHPSSYFIELDIQLKLLSAKSIKSKNRISTKRLFHEDVMALKASIQLSSNLFSYLIEMFLTKLKQYYRENIKR